MSQAPVSRRERRLTSPVAPGPALGPRRAPGRSRAKLLDARESARRRRAPGEPPSPGRRGPDFQATEAEFPVRVQGRSR